MLVAFLVTPLILALVFRDRSERRAEEILHANGLNWRLQPITDQQLRIIVIDNVVGQSFESLTISVQTSRKGAILLFEDHQLVDTCPLFANENGVFATRVMLLRDQSTIGNESYTNLSFGVHAGTTCREYESMTVSQGQGFQPLDDTIEPGAYYRNTRIQIGSVDGKSYAIVVQ